LVLIFLFRSCSLLPPRASPLVLVLLLGGGQLLAAVLADVAAMAGPALLAVHWEAQEVPLGPALLCWGASVFEGIGEPFELSLMLALAYLSVCSRTMSRFKTSLAPAAHEKATDRVIAGVEAIVPLLIFWLLSRMSLPPLSS
jgi:hypothetical protein